TILSTSSARLLGSSTTPNVAAQSSSKFSAQYGISKLFCPGKGETLNTSALSCSALEYSPCISTSTMRADGYKRSLDNVASRLATVVDFPDPVVPTTKLCLLTTLLMSTKAGIESAPDRCPIRTCAALLCLPLTIRRSCSVTR